MAIEVNDVQRVDLNRIRQFVNRFTETPSQFELTGLLIEGPVVAQMVNELIDLVEGSTLLQDAAQARLDAAYQDKSALDPSSTLGLRDIADLDPERILPHVY